MDSFNPTIVNPLPLDSLSYTFANIISAGDPAYSFSQTIPSIQMTFYTPKETQIIPRDMISCYPYNDILRFPTDFNFSYAGGAVNRVSSNNIQLSTIPQKIYVYAKRKNSTLFSSPTYTDSFLGIESINLQYYNKVGILSSASKKQLYEISCANGCNMTWDQWSGGLTYKANYSQFGTVGSVNICRKCY